MNRHRRRSHAFSHFTRPVVLILGASLIAAVPGTAAAIEAIADDVRSADPANEAYDLPPVPQPLTDEQTLPVIDLSELEGVWPEDIVEIVPGKTDPTSPDDAIEGTKALPEEGAASTDAFGFGDNASNHIALVYPEDVNRENASGKWVDMALTLSATSKGWTYTDPAGSVIELPAELSGSTPVKIITPSGGVFTLAPATGTSAGEPSGASVTYPNAFDGADLVYTLAPGGLREDIVLGRQPSKPTFGFSVTTTGLTLAHNEVGGIDVTDETGTFVAALPAPVAYDANPEPASSTGSVTLTETGEGTYALDVAIDEVFLATASYPVTIDPSWDDTTNRDGYTNSGSPSTSYESNTNLQVDSGKRTYVNFNASTVRNAEVLIYAAEMFLFPTASGGVSGGIDAKRVTSAWPNAGTLNWNNQPTVGVVIDSTATQNASGGWWSWDVTELYQHYLDTSSAWNPHWTDEGVALTASNPKTFYSIDANFADPALYITYNNLPNTPGADSPASGIVTNDESLTLKANQIPNDPDGDDVMISFQISTDQNDFTGQNLVFQSPYDDKKSFTTPAGILLDGQTYWWRAVSLDVCDPATEAMCSLTDGAGTLREPNGSVPRSFTVELERLGTDDRWAMWSQDVGNGMTLQVNQGNGNLHLDVPLESFATPIGPMNLSLSYNSLQTTSYGLSAGWDVAVGPRSSFGGLPTRLFKIDGGAESDVKVRFQGGRVLYFPFDHGKLWGATSAMSGYITQAPSGAWTYFDADGGRFNFADTGAMTTNGAQITKAKPAASTGAASDEAFTYIYSGDELTNVRDPLGRDVVLTWTAGNLEKIEATEFGMPTRDLVYTSGKLTSIVTTVSNAYETGGQHTEVLTFKYDANGKVSEVLDAVQSATANSDGWDVAYSGTWGRVSSVTAPESGGPATYPSATAQAWRFTYIDKTPNPTQNAAITCLTDPRNTNATVTCDPDLDADDAFQTQTEFSDAGYPIRVVAPTVNGVRPITRYVFDNHNNLVCERTPEANALGGESCTSAVGGQGSYTDLDDGGLSRVYTYQGKAPYRLLSVTHPGPSDGGFPRLVESYTYDGGASFTGLWAQMYRNASLAGTPDVEAAYTNLDNSFAGGEPAQLNDGDGTWGMRLAGELDFSDLTNGKYKFRIFASDGVRFSVEGKTILDCFGEQKNDPSVSNCETGNDISTFLHGGTAPFEIEYSNMGGDPHLNVKWDQGNGTWATIGGGRFTPQLGLVTSKLYEKLQSGGATPDQFEERWTFATDDAKARRLQASHIREDLSVTSHIYSTTYTYDPTYGQVLTETANSQDAANDVKTTYTYRNAAAPAGWANAGQVVSCVEQTVIDTVPSTDPISTTSECDAAGRTTEQVLSIDAVSGTSQVAQTRTTLTEYDSLGRTIRVQQTESGADEKRVYDAAGRPVKTSVLITGTTWADTVLAYDHAGRLKTETQPDPDGTGSLTSPVTTYLYDQAGNQIRRTDPRGKLWQTGYDAIDRVISTTSPLGAITDTVYQLGTGLNRVSVYPPGTDGGTDTGGVTTTDMNALGRKTSERLEGYAPTTYTYDVLGNVLTMTTPAGIETTSTYSGLSELLTTTDFTQAAGTPALTDYDYDASGRQISVDGPRSGVDEDELTYTYDAFGRLTKTTHEGLTIPGTTSTKVNTLITYNDAGERIEVRTQLNSGTTTWREYTYDGAGREKTMVDPKGMTTTTYNAAGWATKVNDPRASHEINMFYDLLGRLTCRHTGTTCTSGTTTAERFTYDVAGNMLSAASITPAPTYNLTYDDDGRLTIVKRGTSTETTYTYNAAKAQLTSVLDAAGTTAFTYNVAGQIATVDDPFATAVSTYDYDATTGRLATRTDAQANLRWELAYEAATGRLDTQKIRNDTTDAILADFNLGYDLAGNVTSKASTVFANASNTTWSYDYDGGSRLLQAQGENATGAATTWDYLYDGGGNRTGAKETTGSVVSNWTTTYDASSLATTATNAVGGETITYTYDAAGVTQLTANSTLNANDWGYTYDAYSRLTCARSATTTCGSTAAANRVTYTLDAFNRTYQRTLNTTATSYVWRGISEDPASSTTSGTTTTYAYTAGGSPLAQKVGTGAASYYLRDPHGDTVGVVSTAAAEQGTTAFDAYGKPLATSGTQALFGYQSDITDTLTKQVDMGTRWYSPGQGRFTTRDVLFGDPLHPISLNQWAYAGSNPVTMWDPTGMASTAATIKEAPSVYAPSSTVRSLRQDQMTGWGPNYECHSKGCAWGAFSPGPPAPEPPQPKPGAGWVDDVLGWSAFGFELTGPVGAGFGVLADSIMRDSAAPKDAVPFARGVANLLGKAARSPALKFGAIPGLNIASITLSEMEEGESFNEALWSGVVRGTVSFGVGAGIVAACPASGGLACPLLGVAGGVVAGEIPFEDYLDQALREHGPDFPEFFKPEPWRLGT